MHPPLFASVYSNHVEEHEILTGVRRPLPWKHLRELKDLKIFIGQETYL